MRDLTDQERQTVENLAHAWNAFVLLPEIHIADNDDFARAIHAAQAIVFSRPARQEQLPIMFCDVMCHYQETTPPSS